jgi:virginiamycin B lyase
VSEQSSEQVGAHGDVDSHRDMAATDARPGDAGVIRVFTDSQDSIMAPTGIIGTPDGDMWFTSIGNSRIGRVHPSDGEIETFEDPADNIALPANIHPAADGRVWFTCLGSNRLGSIDPTAADPAQTITTMSHAAFDKPVALKAAPDGRLWCSLRGSSALASIDPLAADPASSVTVVAHPAITAPAAIFVDPSGGLWWVNGGNDTIGHLDTTSAAPADTVRVITPPNGLSSLRGWSLDDEGALWLTTQSPAALIRIDLNAQEPEGALRHTTDPRLRTPDGIWLGADRALWFADTDAHTIVRFDPAASADEDAFTMFGQPPLVSAPFDIKASLDPSDRRLWFTDKGANKIGSITT